MQPCFSLCHPFSIWIGQHGGCIQGCTVMGFPSPTISSLSLLSYLWKSPFYAKPSSDFSLITVGEHQPAFPVDSLPYLLLLSREHVEAFIPERILCQVLYKYQLHAAEPKREYSQSFSSERGASLGVCQPGSWECNLKSSQGRSKRMNVDGLCYAGVQRCSSLVLKLGSSLHVFPLMQPEVLTYMGISVITHVYLLIKNNL